jgi:Voltage-dependent anion channel
MLYVLGLLTALVFWGFGLVWLAFAVATIWLNHPLPFNMGWWGFTFPLGVYAVSTMQIGVELPSAFFRIVGTVFAVAVILLWVLVAGNTIRGGIKGTLFVAPCLRDLKEEHVLKGRVDKRRLQNGRTEATEKGERGNKGEGRRDVDEEMGEMESGNEYLHSKRR